MAAAAGAATPRSGPLGALLGGWAVHICRAGSARGLRGASGRRGEQGCCTLARWDLKPLRGQEAKAQGRNACDSLSNGSTAQEHLGQIETERGQIGPMSR